jgi:hypothetical protein
VSAKELPRRRPKDITARAPCMQRDTAILYRNRKPSGADPASYGGLLRLADGQTFWAFIWPRLVRGRPVVELRLVRKQEAAGANN